MTRRNWLKTLAGAALFGVRAAPAAVKAAVKPAPPPVGLWAVTAGGMRLTPGQLARLKAQWWLYSHGRPQDGFVTPADCTVTYTMDPEAV